jgi:hypothetical protein
MRRGVDMPEEKGVSLVKSDAVGVVACRLAAICSV